MKHRINLLALLYICCTLFSCAKVDIEEPLSLFDFGKGKFNEPFVGVLKSRPSILVKSLDWFPFKYMTSDTVYYGKSLDIVSNEECLRSKSKATIMFVDSLFRPIDGVELYYNGQLAPNGKFTVTSDAAEKTITLGVKVLPRLGNSVVEGKIVVDGQELDIVNDVPLQQSNITIADWNSEQVIGWPLLLWLSWGIVALLIVILILLVLYLVFKVLGMIVNILKYPFSARSKPKVKNATKQMKENVSYNEDKQNRSRKEEEEKRKEDDDDDDDDDEWDKWDVFLNTNVHLKVLTKKFKADLKGVFVGIENRNIKIEPELLQVNYDKGFIIIQHKMYSYTKMQIMNEANLERYVTAMSGAIGKEGGPVNEFLNHLMPNKSYHVDNGRYIYHTNNANFVYRAEMYPNIPTKPKGSKDLGTMAWIRKVNLAGSNKSIKELFPTREGAPHELINHAPINRIIK